MANMNKLRGIMAEAGMTQGSLAKQVGMSRGAFNLKLNGKSPFNVDEVQKICTVLGISDRELKCQIFL